MPIELFLMLLTGVLFVGGSVAIALWDKVLGWAEEHLTPWVAEHAPHLSKYLADGYVVLDRAAVKIRRAVRKAWVELRKELLKQFVDYTRQLDGTWKVVITSWLMVKDQNIMKKITSEKTVAYDELPDEIREEFLRRQQQNQQIDVTKLRDAQVLNVEN